MRGIAIVVIVVVATAARADDRSKPWAANVPDDVQAKANALFSEANQLFAQQAHAPALDKYRAAIELWDHPMIRFNMAVTLIRLDRFLDAADALDHALRFGVMPFPPELYQQALDYKRLLASQVGDIAASCRQAGVRIALDGKSWFECPGREHKRVMIGEHELAGERDGYLPSRQHIVVVGGATATRDIALVTFDAAVKLEYRHRRWVPWTIAGAGTAVALVGLGAYLMGRSQLDGYYRDYAALCPTGCKPPQSNQAALASQKSSAQLAGSIGLTGMIAGGAVAIGGIVFAVINRPVRTLPRLEVAPTAGGATASLRWSLR
jgi:tetratricopeptide (TPR) repeat protein